MTPESKAPVNDSKNILIVAVGSRGDNEPFHAFITHVLSLPTSTSTSDNKNNLNIHLFSSPAYNALLNPLQQHHNTRLHLHDASLLSLPSMLSAMSAHYTPPATAKPVGDPQLQGQLHAMGAIVAHCVTPCIPELHAIITQHKIDLIMCTSLALGVCASLAEAKAIPTIAIHFQPNAPTAEYPCYLSSRANAEQAATILVRGGLDSGSYIGERIEESCTKSGDGFEASYDALLWFYRAGMDKLNEFRTSELLQLPKELTENDMLDILKGKNDKIVQVHSYTRALFSDSKSSPTQTDNTVTKIDSLASSYIPHEWTSSNDCPLTLSFINSKTSAPSGNIPLIAVSLGSMRLSDERKQEVTKALVNGVRNSIPNARLVMLGYEYDDNQGALSDVWCVPKNETVQFSWLFPQCDVVLCHGGAGVVSAAIAAGCCVVVLPIMCDQFFWATAVEVVGVGAYVRSGMNGANVEEIETSVKKVMSDEVKETCKQMGRGKQNRELHDGEHGNDGCKELLDVIHLLL